MTLQLLRRTARYVTIRLVGSYPTFSPLPLPERSGGYFLLRYSTLADSFLLGSRMLCVARTFLLHADVHATDRPTALDCKNTSFILFYPKKVSQIEIISNFAIIKMDFNEEEYPPFLLFPGDDGS